jgi:hypothetical protein
MQIANIKTHCNACISLRNADRVSLPRDETQSANPRENSISPIRNRLQKMVRQPAGHLLGNYTASRDGRANYITSDYHNIILKAISRLRLKKFARFLVFKD